MQIPLRQGTVGLLVDKNSSEQFPCHVFKHSVEEAIGTCTVSYTISGTSKKVDSTLNEAQVLIHVFQAKNVGHIQSIGLSSPKKDLRVSIVLCNSSASGIVQFKSS